jgi:general secretion pathway protein A
MALYLEFFNMKEPPYTSASDGRFFYESDQHAEALANMLYTIQHRKGMVLVTGEIGSGKTFLSSMLASRLDGTSLVAHVRHPSDSGKQLLRAVAQALDIKASADEDRQTLVSRIEDQLKRLNRRRVVAAILDESQDMADSAMEEIRLMWNWEADGRRLLQIVLVGQPQLRDRLMEEKWEALQQRVAMSYHLGRLSPKDTARYILHRRHIAAPSGSPLQFTIHALEGIYKASRGVPRLINMICDNALLLAYSKSTCKVSSGIIAEVLKDMTFWHRGELPSAQDSSESQ